MGKLGRGAGGMNLPVLVQTSMHLNLLTPAKCARHTRVCVHNHYKAFGHAVFCLGSRRPALIP